MQIVIDDRQLQKKLNDAADKLADTSPLMQRISVSLFDATEENFSAEGRPAWAGLKNPRKGGRILQDSGQLAVSISANYGADFASVGSNKVYAAIHQFGGMTGRGHKAEIKPRPFLPLDENGNLQREAHEDIADTIDAYLKTIL